MQFEEKIKFLRALPQFKVVPISEVKAIAFAAQEASTAEPDMHVLGSSNGTLLALTGEDIEKIVRVYPDLKQKLE